MNTYLLTINSGSSSIKFALYPDNGPPVPHLRGSIENTDGKESVLSYYENDSANPKTQKIDSSNSREIVPFLSKWLEEHVGALTVKAVGYRIVHGGPAFIDSVVITEGVLKEFINLIPFDVEHMPRQIELIGEFKKYFPGIIHIACFDTRFHKDLPLESRLLPIPRVYESQGVRRYGFHGLSYTSVMEKLNDLENDSNKKQRVIIAHLGSGSSLAAVKNGKSVDTSMSFTPASGIPMSSRSGDIDPGIFEYLSKTAGLDYEEINLFLNHKSGLLGISGKTGDMYKLLNLEKTDQKASEAISVFCYRVRQCIGGYIATLSGLDTLIFTGGIGEKSARIRQLILENLGFLGIELDNNLNSQNSGIISASSSKVTVRVIPADEQAAIAGEMHKILNGNENH